MWGFVEIPLCVMCEHVCGKYVGMCIFMCLGVGGSVIMTVYVLSHSNLCDCIGHYVFTQIQIHMMCCELRYTFIHSHSH